MCYFLVYGSYSLTPGCGHLSTNAGWVTDFICFYMKHLGTRGLGVFCFLRCLIGPILLNNICFRQELFLDWRDVDEICIKITWIVLKRHNIYSSTVLKKKEQRFHSWWFTSPPAELCPATRRKENDVMQIEAMRDVSIKTFVTQTNQEQAATFISSLSPCPLVFRLPAPLLLWDSWVTFGYLCEMPRVRCEWSAAEFYWMSDVALA